MRERRQGDEGKGGRKKEEEGTVGEFVVAVVCCWRVGVDHGCHGQDGAERHEKLHDWEGYLLRGKKSVD